MTRSGHHSRYELICYNKNKLHGYRIKIIITLNNRYFLVVNFSCNVCWPRKSEWTPQRFINKTCNCYLYRTNLGFSIPQLCRILRIITNAFFFFHFEKKTATSNWRWLILYKIYHIKKKYLCLYLFKENNSRIVFRKIFKIQHS